MLLLLLTHGVEIKNVFVGISRSCSTFIRGPFDIFVSKSFWMILGKMNLMTLAIFLSQYFDKGVKIHKDTCGMQIFTKGVHEMNLIFLSTIVSKILLVCRETQKTFAFTTKPDWHSSHISCHCRFDFEVSFSGSQSYISKFEWKKLN